MICVYKYFFVITVSTGKQTDCSLNLVVGNIKYQPHLDVDHEKSNLSLCISISIDSE